MISDSNVRISSTRSSGDLSVVPSNGELPLRQQSSSVSSTTYDATTLAAMPERRAASADQTVPMDAAEIQVALDDVFDQAIVFHAFTDYMRDYEVVTFAVADPLTGIAPAYDRYLFKHCVEAHATTAVAPDIWQKSLDERLIDFEIGRELDGYVWGVRWQCLYPGAKVVADSETAKRWQADVGIVFHEVRIETNGHDLTLVFHDLEVTTVGPGYAPFVVSDDAIGAD